MDQIKVLLVDDEEDLSLVLAERLQIRGFDALGVTDAQTALEQINQKDFDVVVIDVRMPGTDGVQLMKKIKERKPKTEIILFTGHCNQMDDETGIKEGAFDYLIKPVQIDDLISKIKKAASAE